MIFVTGTELHIYLFIYLFIFSSFIYLVFSSFIYLFIFFLHLFIYSFIHSFIYCNTVDHCVRYVKERAFPDPYFPVYGQNRIFDSFQIRENADAILSIHGEIRIGESPYFDISHAVRDYL